MKVTGMNRTTEQRNLLRIYSIDKKENGICLQICSNKTEEKIEESQKKGDSDMAEFDYEVVNGRKIRVRPVETVSEVDENGYFVRQPNHFTEGFGEGKNPVEAGRYRLVWAKLCHWSNRASIVRELLGLDEAISVNMVDHADHEKNLGWEFVYDKDNVDPVLDIQFLSEAYYKADDDYTGRTTVPALIDVKTGKVVNNDYHKLTNYFEVDFKPFHKKNAPDLYPEELRNEIDEMNYWLFDNINNGVYKTTFCRSKEAYWDAYNSFYAAMDLLEERLENQRFLFGDYVTDSDVRLYVTLARLDIRYTHQLGHTKHPLFTYKNLWGYARDLYQIPAFKIIHILKILQIRITRNREGHSSHSMQDSWMRLTLMHTGEHRTTEPDSAVIRVINSKRKNRIKKIYNSDMEKRYRKAGIVRWQNMNIMK